MDILRTLAELRALAEAARPMPLSSGGAVVNRDRLLDLVDHLAMELPREMEQAQHVLRERDEVIAEARRQADRLIEQVRHEAQRLVSEDVLVRAAQQEAAAIRNGALAEAQQMRAETEDFIDSRLASFEVVLGRTLDSVRRGRERMSGIHPYDTLDTGA